MIETHRCPVCKNLIEFKIIGSVQGWYCSDCGWNVVTTHMDPIKLDEKKYKIVNPNVIKADVAQIKVISKISNLNFLQSQELLGEKNSIIYEGVAEDIIEKVKLLRANNIKYSINPSFPYNID